MTLWSDGKTSEDIQKLSEVDGNSVAYNLHEDLLCVKEDLAKANERVRELETQHQLLTKQIEPLLDMQEDGEHYARCHLADDIYEAFIEGSSVDALNKFAIEQQNKGVEDYKKSDEFCRLLDSHFNSGKVYGHNEYYEHLRKEQE